jgi:hypothetical protein
VFIGHFGLALAGKRVAPRTSLATLFLATQFIDVLWPIFLLLGLEHYRVAPGITKVQPLDFYDISYTHSLTMVLRWALAFGLVYYLLRRYVAGAWVVGGLVLSHWFLDWIVHRPDLPVWRGGPKVGLGLWNSWAASISVEAILFAAGIWIYLRSTRARDRKGIYLFWSVMGLLFLGWLAALFGPTPPNVNQLAIGALVMWGIFIPAAWWADRHREAVDAAERR